VGQRVNVREEDYILFLWKRKRKLSVGIRSFVSHRLVSAVRTVEFESDRKVYRPIVLRGRWYNITALNVRASSDGKKRLFKRQSLQENIAGFRSFS
jgi:hypothetical protein